MKIGFIGQGWIGKNYADSFEGRGFSVVRYSQESPYVGNKGEIGSCDIVFIAVPTPTTPEGFDGAIVREVIRLVGKGKIAVIKSTVVPGTTQALQKENPGIIVLNSPEFLSEATARHDADHPVRNIVGMPTDVESHKKAAELVLSILPKAPYERICTSAEAEFIKYGANTFFYVKIVYMNMLYDLAQKYGADWSVIKDAFVNNPWMGTMHSDPIHKSGRGAGGNCFIKDFAAFSQIFEKELGDRKSYMDVLRSIKDANLDLLASTNKDTELVRKVYGEASIKNTK
jgi:UDPglucose 6-dehydrogenase